MNRSERRACADPALADRLRQELKRSLGTSMRGIRRQEYAAHRTGNQVSSRRLAV